jgi:hypothetical protein
MGDTIASEGIRLSMGRVAGRRGREGVMDEVSESGSERRFGLSDALALVASLAVSLVLLRTQDWFARIALRMAFWFETMQAMLGTRPWNLPGMTRGQAVSWVAATMIDEFLVQLLATLLAGLVLTQPLLRLRRPRPPLRELVRQSGLATCVGVILFVAATVDLQWITGNDVSSILMPILPLSLLWPVLGLPPWRKEPSWIDRLGRAVGWGWIAVLVSGLALQYL